MKLFLWKQEDALRANQAADKFLILSGSAAQTFLDDSLLCELQMRSDGKEVDVRQSLSSPYCEKKKNLLHTHAHYKLTELLCRWVPFYLNSC